MSESFSEVQAAKVAFLQSLVGRAYLNQGDASLDAITADKKEDRPYPYYWCSVAVRRSASGALQRMMFYASGEVSNLVIGEENWRAAVQVCNVTHPFVTYSSTDSVSGKVPK